MSKPAIGKRIEVLEASIAEILALLGSKAAVVEAPKEVVATEVVPKGKVIKPKYMHKTKSVIQSLLIPKSWGLEEATKWAMEHDYKVKKVDKTQKYFRFRQRKPNDKDEFYTISLPSGIKMVMEDLVMKPRMK